MGFRSIEDGEAPSWHGRHVEDVVRPNFPGPLNSAAGDTLLGSNSRQGDPAREDEIRAANNLGAATIAGVRDAASGLAGLGDLAYMAGDWMVGDDPVQSEWDLGGKTARAFDPLLPTPGWQPTTGVERAIAGFGEAATAFAVPGGLGARWMNKTPTLLRQGPGAYAQAATQDLGKNAARLGAANIAASQGSQYAQSQDMGMAGQIGIPMAAALIADPSTGLAMSMKGRQQARMMAQEAVPSASKGSVTGTKIAESIKRRITGRLGTGEVTTRDVVSARDHFHNIVSGRTERITNDQIDALRAGGDEIGANGLEATKKVLDILIDELGMAGQARGPLPTTAGWLGGAEVPGQQIQGLSRSMAAEPGSYGAEAVAKNRAAREATSQRAIDISPRGRGEAVEGTTESVRAARDRSMAASLEEAGDPWVSGFMDETLKNVKPIKSKSVRMEIDDAMNEMNLTQAKRDQINIDDIMERIETYSVDGEISANEFNDVIQILVEETAVAGDMSKVARRLRGDIQKRMRGLLETRMEADSPGDYEKFAEAKRRYSVHQETFDPKITKNEKQSRGMDRLATSKIAEALGTTKGTTGKARSYTQTADALAGVPGDPEDIAAGIRRVMIDDPASLAEVEQNLWRALLGDVADPRTTSNRLAKQQGDMAGAIDLDDEGKVLAIYRSLVGDERADEAVELVKLGRQSRYDDSGTNAAAYKSGSSADMARGGAAREIGETAISNDRTARILRLTLRAVGAGGSNKRIDAVIKQAMLDPKLAHDLLNIPSGAAFKEWRDRWAQRTSAATVRESVKDTGRGAKE